jgi:hypothetical protein
MISKMFDAAFPPQSVPGGCQAVLGYVGGRADHVWTLEEWDRFHSLRQLPCWVADISQSPAAQASGAIRAAMGLGWAPHQPDTRVIVCDLETAIAPAWYQVFAADVASAGFVAVAYGSLSTVLNCAAIDVLAADWNGVPQLQPGQTIHGHQYQANVAFQGTKVDYSAIDEWLFVRGGQGPRHV